LHQPIINDDLCQRVLATLSRRSIAEDRRYICTKDTTVLLAGLIYCDVCQAKRHYTVNKRPNSPWRGFRCKTKVDGGKEECSARSVVAAPIETQILDITGLLSVALDGNWIEEALAIAEQQLAAPIESPITIDPAKIHEKIRRLGRLYADGVKSDQEYETELAALRAQFIAHPCIYHHAHA
jgi:hypothetical protein